MTASAPPKSGVKWRIFGGGRSRAILDWDPAPLESHPHKALLRSIHPSDLRPLIGDPAAVALRRLLWRLHNGDTGLSGFGLAG